MEAVLDCEGEMQRRSAGVCSAAGWGIAGP